MLQEFKKSLRSPHHGTKRNLFKVSQSLGSITALFATSEQKNSTGISPSAAKNISNISKSEEILDSLKSSISDSGESISEEDNSENSNTSEDKLSP